MTDCDIRCVLPIGSGDWTAYLADRLTGAELPLERTTWRGNAGRAFTAVSEASIVLDPEYAIRFGRRPVLWNNELRYRRDDGMMWTGPIVTVDDDHTDGVVWEARDRMELVMQRRWFWRSGTYAGDSANMMTIALRAADYGDPTGLIFDPRSTGVITDMPVIAGDKVGPEIERLGIPWTVIGDVVRYGNILVDTELELPADAFGDERPTIVADGYERLSHVAAVTDGGDRVFFPSADPDDRPPGTPLLVDTIDVGDVSTGAARDLARQEWHRRQGELTIVADDRRPLTGEFPLQWDDLVPGAVLLGTSQGRQLTADNVPVRLDGVGVELADGRELDATGSLTQATEYDLGSPYLHDLAAVDGIVFAEGETYPLGQFDGIDWPAIGLAPTGEFDAGIDSAPFPGIDPIDVSALDGPLGIDGIDPLFSDPYANCPPSQCCDLCDTGSGAGGAGGVTVAAAALDFTDVTGYFELPLPSNAVSGAQLVMQLFIYHTSDHGPYPLPDVFSDSWTVHVHDHDPEVDAFPILPPDDTIGTIIVASRTWDGDARTLQVSLDSYDTTSFGQVICATGVGPVEVFDYVPLYIPDNVEPTPPEQGLYPIARPVPVTNDSLIIQGWTKSIFTLSHDPNNDGTGCVNGGDANVPGYTNLFGLPYDEQLWAMYSDDLWPAGELEQQQVYICANAFAQSIGFWGVALPKLQ